MESNDAKNKLYTTHYQIAVGGVALIVAVIAWAIANRSLAFASAIVGLYALHLMSIRMILEAHREHQASLEGQWSFLRKLVRPALESGLRLELPTGRFGRQSARAKKVEQEEPAETAVEGAIESSAGEFAATLGFESQASPPAAEAAVGEAVAAAAVADRTAAATPKRTQSAGGPRNGTNVPVPRHFALGTVALVRNMLTPAEVARVLFEQRHRTNPPRFATLAVELGLLTETQREELLLAQQEGLFTDAEMRDARRRLMEFRESAAAAMSEAE